MNISSAVPSDHPLMLAWGAYKLTEEFANSRRWAAHAAHVDGSLWAAFVEGWNRRAPAQPEPVPALPEDVVMVPRSALRWLFGEEGEFVCPESRYFRGKPPTYWWRGVFRELIAKTAQPAAPTPDTFMGEPVLTRWKPLNRDESRLALHQSMHNRSFGNPSDDKLMLEWLWENGYALCKREPDEAAPTVVEPPTVDPAEIGEEVAAWLGDAYTQPRSDNGSPERWVKAPVIRLGHAIAACVNQLPAPRASTVVEPPSDQRVAVEFFTQNPSAALVAFQRWMDQSATPPRAALTDGDIDSATANRRDALLDHIEEYGTTSEGVRPLVRQLARAVIAADRGEK